MYFQIAQNAWEPGAPPCSAPGPAVDVTAPHRPSSCCNYCIGHSGLVLICTQI